MTLRDRIAELEKQIAAIDIALAITDGEIMLLAEEQEQIEREGEEWKAE